MGNPLLDALLRAMEVTLAGTPGSRAAQGRSSRASLQAAMQRGRQTARRHADFRPPHAFEEARPALWGQDIATKRILGWHETGRLVVNVPWPDGFEPRVFIEAPDGFLYSVHLTASGTRTVKRWRVRGSAIVDLQVLIPPENMPPGVVIVGDRAPERAMIGPDGRVYFKGFGGSGGGIESWWALTEGPTWTLVQEVVNPSPVTDFLNLDDGSGDPACGGVGLYCTHLNSNQPDPASGLWSRFFREAILSTGRWVAADAIPSTGGIVNPYPLFPGGMEIIGPEASALCEVGNSTCGGGDYVAVTARVWGDAWWERVVPAVWSVVSNGGLSSVAANVALDVFGSLVTNPCNPSPFAATRQLQAAGVLPQVTFTQNLYGCFPYDANVPWQNVAQLRVDGTHIYILLWGDYDVNGIFHRAGIWRAPIPAAGQAPVWTQILVEPDVSATPAMQWMAFELTDNFLWVAEAVYGGPGKTNLVRYNKDGTERSVRSIVQNVADHLNLQTAWRHRWQ